MDQNIDRLIVSHLLFANQMPRSEIRTTRKTDDVFIVVSLTEDTVLLPDKFDRKCPNLKSIFQVDSDHCLGFIDIAASREAEVAK